jgi:D-aminoacyl-tRNA deacylase
VKLVLQRVRQAGISVDGREVSRIGAGFLILIGVSRDDTGDEISWLARKVAELRVFPDEAGKMNRSLSDIGGEALVVSQFTLFAECAHGRRPDFLQAASPEPAETLYLRFAEALSAQGIPTRTGVFGAHMDIDTICDGPVTILLERP